MDSRVYRVFVTPTYTSTSTMLVLTKETTLASLADLQLGSQLTKDYTVLINSRPVLEQVIENLSLDIDYKSLRESITIDNPVDTRILTLSVVQSDPEMAKAVVDELAKVSSAYIGDKNGSYTSELLRKENFPYIRRALICVKM